MKKEKPVSDCTACRWWRNLNSGAGMICPMRANFNAFKDHRHCELYAPVAWGEYIDRKTAGINGYSSDHPDDLATIAECKKYLDALKERNRAFAAGTQ